MKKRPFAHKVSRRRRGFCGFSPRKRHSGSEGRNLVSVLCKNMYTTADKCARQRSRLHSGRSCVIIWKMLIGLIQQCTSCPPRLRGGMSKRSAGQGGVCGTPFLFHRHFGESVLRQDSPRPFGAPPLINAGGKDPGVESSRSAFFIRFPSGLIY